MAQLPPSASAPATANRDTRSVVFTVRWGVGRVRFEGHETALFGVLATPVILYGFHCFSKIFKGCLELTLRSDVNVDNAKLWLALSCPSIGFVHIDSGNFAAAEAEVEAENAADNWTLDLDVDVHPVLRRFLMALSDPLASNERMQKDMTDSTAAPLSQSPLASAYATLLAAAAVERLRRTLQPEEWSFIWIPRTPAPTQSTLALVKQLRTSWVWAALPKDVADALDTDLYACGVIAYEAAESGQGLIAVFVGRSAE